LFSSHNAHNSDKHYEHVLHQYHNKPWAAIYVAAFFFFMIALGALAFYAIQHAAQAGWSPLLFRVMEGVTAYLLPGSIIMFVLLGLSALNINHLFVWADPEVVAHDELIQGKQSWLNAGWFLIRAAIFLAGWNAYRYFSRKYSLNQDEDPKGNVWYKKNFKISAIFLVFFIYTESMMSWDWIMSFDPHWFSTLFGWYVFASMFVSGITVIALITIVLKSQGYLEKVNNSHIHDLAKFMFGNDFKLPFFGMVAMNFLFPVLVLINSDFKRINWLIVIAGIVILLGHYLDVFNMVMPATVGKSWFIGFAEIGALFLFLGLFIYVVFSALTKSSLEAKGSLMTVFLVLLVVALLGVTFWQLSKIFQLSQGKVDNSQVANDSDNNRQGKYMLYFVLAMYAMTIYCFVAYRSYFLPETASEHGKDYDTLMFISMVLIMFVQVITQFGERVMLV